MHGASTTMYFRRHCDISSSPRRHQARTQALVVLLYVMISLVSANSQDELVMRETIYGTLQGFSIQGNTGPDQRLDVFVGVPFAKPPTGPLRWSPPEYPDPWAGVRNATSYSPCCMQVPDNLQDWYFGPGYNNTNEDCLYLNIFAPRNLSNAVQTYGVYVWVHGGSFTSGCGEGFDGRVLAQRGNIIVISVNYRLGAIGFLSTDDPAAEGNYGMMDVVHALRWVHDNIATFGGDPSRVTVGGNSAGGAVASELMFIPEASGLFSGIASFSGDAFCAWALYRPPVSMVTHTEMLAEYMGCPTTDTYGMVDCLRTKDAMEIVTFVEEGIGQGVNPFNIAFSPRVDGTFIPDLPENMIDRGDFNQVILLSGVSANESTYFYDTPEEGFPRHTKEAYMSTFSSFYYGDDADVTFAAISHQYDAPGDIWTDQRDLLLNMITDFTYTAPHTDHTRRHSKYVDDTYSVTLDHRSENHPTPEHYGVPHSEEICYIAGCMFWDHVPCPWGCYNIIYPQKINWTASDAQVSLNMMDTWAALVDSGSPSTPYFQWPKFNITEESVSINNDTWTTRSFSRYGEMEFWNDMLPGLLNETSACPFT